jgi:phosphoribosylformylglycinamidine synthase subunit PurS
VRVRVDVRRRPGLSDPEGATTHRALLDLGYAEVTGVHFGRSIYLDVTGDDPEGALARVREMCERLLANPVIEDFTVTVEDGGDGP